MAFSISKVASLIKSIVDQGMAKNEIVNVDSSNLVSVGNLVLSSTDNTEWFLNTLVQRIGKTILSFRKYRNKLSDMVLDDFEYGAIVQKLKVFMPEVEEDQMYNLVDGESVDHYKISKPKVNQKFFASETPYQIKITIQRSLLKEAFISEAKMGGFISLVYGEVQNKLELTLESLGRTCLTNFMASGPKTYNLVTEYNAEAGTALDGKKALLDPDFDRYMVRRIKGTMASLTDIRTDFNMTGMERHTPIGDQRVKIISDAQYAIETTVEYAAFNDQYVNISGYSVINFWQQPDDAYRIIVTPNTESSDAKNPVDIDNIVCVIYDRDALGIYKMNEDVLTTPVNAAAGYYNTFWHEKQLWFNDQGENFVMFTLN